ncbi:hypothetical protein REPUB_Repub05bG0024400 [Reevesia pubescens]
MEEASSPRQRAPMLNRLLQSPTTSFFLDSNNDQLERAQARAAARAAAFIRTSALAPPPPTPPSDPCLSKDQIIELFKNCIKLATENKINQKNTWELKLIDHLSEIIKAETAEGYSETNFQKASCTLEAGVKIYSFRVDALHTDAYKVLGGIHRAGQDDKQETIVDGDNVSNREESCHAKKESEKKISPISTLEYSFEALNVKKFDVAFAVDPLYHQTSSQFDEGGAKGLLLNNLGVYEGCRVLFDSFEIPGKCKSGLLQNNNLDMIDISFAKESVEEMVTNMLSKNEICPTLKVIISQFGEDNQRSSETFDGGQKCDIRVDAADANEVGFNENSLGNYDPWAFDNDEASSIVDEGSNLGPSHHEENDNNASCEPDLEDIFEDVAKFLFQGLGFTSKQNAWAGPSHWKYWNCKGSEDIPARNVESALTTKKPKSKNLKEVDVDFRRSLDKEMPDVFVPPKNPKLLLLPANRAPCDNTLPEDCHYQPDCLVKLFLLPNIMMIVHGNKTMILMMHCHHGTMRVCFVVSSMMDMFMMMREAWMTLSPSLDR